ncbi:MAG: TlpA family protein disulfide reductase [Phycisphaerales bacterium]|nr:MAG: TlpA family protein disulfide reductase [Phycisphaerales bacterium]
MCHLQKRYEEFEDKGVVVLGFNSSDDKQIALDFMRANGATFPNVLDNSYKAVKLMLDDYRSSGVPLNYIIDRQGRVVEAWYGYEEGHEQAIAALKKAGAELDDL